MEFKVGEKYRIKTDQHNWMFQEYKRASVDKRTGKEKEDWDTWGYWGTAHQLAKAIPDMWLRRSEGKLSEIMPEYRSQMDELLNVLDDIRSKCDALLAP